MRLLKIFTDVNGIIGIKNLDSNREMDGIASLNENTRPVEVELNWEDGYECLGNITMRHPDTNEVCTVKRIEFIDGPDFDRNHRPQKQKLGWL